ESHLIRLTGIQRKAFNGRLKWGPFDGLHHDPECQLSHKHVTDEKRFAVLSECLAGLTRCKDCGGKALGILFCKRPSEDVTRDYLDACARRQRCWVPHEFL